MKTILVCGDRNWSDSNVIRHYLSLLPPDQVRIVHGGARGADSIAGDIAVSLGMSVTIVSAQWDAYGKAAGPIRNRTMFDTYHPDLVLAFHSNIQESKGTKDMVTYAKKNGCEVQIVK